MVTLTTCIPLIVHLLRPLYKRKQPISLPQDEEVPVYSEAQSTSFTQADVVSEVSDHLDVHVAIGSWAIESLAYIAVGTTMTLYSQLACQCNLSTLRKFL